MIVKVAKEVPVCCLQWCSSAKANKTTHRYRQAHTEWVVVAYVCNPAFESRNRQDLFRFNANQRYKIKKKKSNKTIARNHKQAILRPKSKQQQKIPQIDGNVEMAQHLRALAVPPSWPGFNFQHPHSSPHSRQFQLQGIWHPLLALMGIMHRHTCRQNTRTQ